ncbi:hypothetical protein VTP01DRAFT_4030 [Rhizomucor pusillus]|uniref:uncharacterized protein n=1 Tax=Rhizomucor pusillus TaxID=4840 RepID=UPI003742124D
MAMSTSSSSSSVKGKKPYKSWVKDGVNGGPSSMDILINWLANKANYARWRGSNNDGSAERIPKKILLEEIISEMQNAGIHHRLPKDVASKISTLQSNYRSAREWYDTDGKKLQQAGAKEDIIHEELLKRFPYWDALNESFGAFRPPPAWAMSISSIMDQDEPEGGEQQDEDDSCGGGGAQEDITDDSRPRQRRRLSDDSSSPSALNESILAKSLLQVTREKEAGRMKRSQDMLDFLREKRVEREQLLIEKERTRRIRAKAELVKNLMEAGFSKQEIAEQLRLL